MACMFATLLLFQGLVPNDIPDPAAMQVRWIDVDSDGRLDLHLFDETAGQRLFFGEATGFREAALDGDLARPGPARFALWSDLDRDGLPELLTCTADGALRLSRAPHGILEPYELGLEGLAGVRAAEWVDFDQDGWSDLWIRRDDDWALFANRPGSGGRTLELVPGGRLAPATPAPLAAAEHSASGTTPGSGPADSVSGSEPRSQSSQSLARPRYAAMPARSVPPTPAGAPLLATTLCAQSLLDQATGNCIKASSVPALGKLHPLSTALNVDGIGRVGMGTTTPAWPLHVVGTQGVGRFDSTAHTFGSVIELRNQTAGAAYLGAINFVDSAGLFRGQIGYLAAGAMAFTEAMAFNVAGTERMRFNWLGHLGIGTSSPFHPVHVSGALSNFSTLMRVEALGNPSSSRALDVSISSPNGEAVRAANTSTAAGFSAGVVGSSASPTGYGVYANGNFGGSGAKYFVQPHPSDPGKEIRFVCLEGNESGTYFRGSARLRGGRAVIDVPEEFRLVSESTGITVQVTPIGQAVPLAVESYDLERIAVVGSPDVEFHYFVNGVRRGFGDLECVRENYAYVPEERGVPYGTQYPPALRAILVENGILNADFTPNEATAARLGWRLTDPAPSHPSSAAGQ
jgi:hypothetical protein